MLHDEIYKIKSTTSNLSCVNEISSNHMHVHDICTWTVHKICTWTNMSFGTARQNNMYVT